MYVIDSHICLPFIQPIHRNRESEIIFECVALSEQECGAPKSAQNDDDCVELIFNSIIWKLSDVAI